MLVEATQYATLGARASDYACDGFTLHTVASGAFFVVWNDAGRRAGHVIAPNKARGEFHWQAYAAHSGMITDKAVGPKSALRAIVEHWRAIDATLQDIE
jgi:hypothetical protein